MKNNFKYQKNQTKLRLKNMKIFNLKNNQKTQRKQKPYKLKFLLLINLTLTMIKQMEKQVNLME